MHEFVPQRTSAYISQYDIHLPQLTVRETLAFSAKCQGVGTGYGKLKYEGFIWYDNMICIQFLNKKLFHLDGSIGNVQICLQSS